MLLAHLTNRSLLENHTPPTDRSHSAHLLPFSLACRTRDDESTCLAFHRYAYVDDCISDLRLMRDELIPGEYHHYKGLPGFAEDDAFVIDIHAHGQLRLSLHTNWFNDHATGDWQQIWPFLGVPFALHLPDTEPSPLADDFPF